MKLRTLILIVAWSLPVIGQDKPKDPPVPSLSTADRVALQSLEKVKADAQKAWNDANQQELAIEREWMASHPGFQIDPQNFLITAEPNPKK